MSGPGRSVLKWNDKFWLMHQVVQIYQRTNLLIISKLKFSIFNSTIRNVVLYRFAGKKAINETMGSVFATSFRAFRFESHLLHYLQKDNNQGPEFKWYSKISFAGIGSSLKR